jgi:2-C-methyl-D-erythritol 4-phosphate cytidylyltransferase
MPKYHALIPAAGSGSRMSGEIPKQYLMLCDRPLLYHAAERLLSHPQIDHVLIVLAPGDERFAAIDWGPHSQRIAPLYCGGATRAASVFNGLLAASDAIDADDWVIVHDAARPCLAASALARLIETLHDDETGGLLAMPVVDTLKRADSGGRVAETVPRDSLWRAQTPQMFRYGVLLEGLRNADLRHTTDEAHAVERLRLKPRLVPGDERNLKVTYPEDLRLAELILESMGREE